MLREIMHEIRTDIIKTTYFVAYMIAASLDAMSEWITLHFLTDNR